MVKAVRNVPANGAVALPLGHNSVEEAETQQKSLPGLKGTKIIQVKGKHENIFIENKSGILKKQQNICDRMVFVATSHEIERYLPSGGFYFYDFVVFSNIGKNLFVFCVQNQKDISAAIIKGKLVGGGFKLPICAMFEIITVLITSFFTPDIGGDLNLLRKQSKLN